MRKIDWALWLAIVGAAVMGMSAHWSSWEHDGAFTLGLIMALPLLAQWPKRMVLWK